MCHNEYKVISKFGKHRVSRLPPPPDSPDISPCDFWLFGMLKGIFKDREFNSYDEIGGEITRIWDGLTFDDVERVVWKWMSRLAWVIENGGEYTHE
jgi:hypothetical protein